jgi:hypothetical protein
VDHAQPVNGGVDPTQLRVNGGDRLRPRHVVNVDFQKTAEWNSCRPPCFIFPTNGNLSIKALRIPQSPVLRA